MTLGYNNWLVRWAYLFRKGIPNETTRKDFIWLALVQVPWTILSIATVVGYVGLIVWRHPLIALVLPYAFAVLGAIVYFAVKVDQLGDIEIFGYLREKYKIYFE